ncbi:hypothetical protein Lal_00031073 [Lupinus albus]|nr:hypothetical protein Lal_00031073 [Lupinus albus]
MIGGELLPDKSNNRVRLMYLPLLRDLTRVHRYSWGSACLANLYKEMCRATKPNAKAMGGCLTLLPFLAPIVDLLPTYLFASRNLNYRGIPHGDLTGYRSRLDCMDINDIIILLFKSFLIKLTQHFKWLPYENYVNNLPREVLQDKNIWSACTALICFSIVEWHQTDRNLDALHRVDKQGNLDTNWTTRHAEWIDYWSHRRDQVQQGPQIQYSIHRQQYIMWYRINTRLFLS